MSSDHRSKAASLVLLSLAAVFALPAHAVEVDSTWTGTIYSGDDELVGTVTTTVKISYAGARELDGRLARGRVRLRRAE